MLEQKRKRNQSQKHLLRNPAKVKNVVPPTLFEQDANRRQKPCKVCAGMPWARTPERITDGKDGYVHRVVNDNGRCRGCDEPYAPEPAPVPGVILRSSSGMVAAHGTLHGADISRPGSGPRKR
jgi:hypothetical protein